MCDDVKKINNKNSLIIRMNTKRGSGGTFADMHAHTKKTTEFIFTEKTEFIFTD